MATNDYHFVTHWRARGPIEEIYPLISDAPQLPRWWPSVYLDARELAPADEKGGGKLFSLHTRGWLPYTLRWQSRITEDDCLRGFAIEARGDFVGTGRWSFEQDGAWVDIRYDWQIRAEKPLLRSLSLVLKPIFSANHRWAMAQGEKSLRAELARHQDMK